MAGEPSDELDDLEQGAAVARHLKAFERTVTE